jgi:hypothetical protein
MLVGFVVFDGTAIERTPFHAVGAAVERFAVIPA